MTTLTITNSFHGTSARFRPRPFDQTISARTAKRIRDKLCGCEGCTCGGPLGERGKDFLHDADGRAWTYWADVIQQSGWENYHTGAYHFAPAQEE